MEQGVEETTVRRLTTTAHLGLPHRHEARFIPYVEILHSKQKRAPLPIDMQVTHGGPRACGGGPLHALINSRLPGWSPRMRGWSPHRGRRTRHPAVVPAHAGVVPDHHRHRTAHHGGPRACGGGPFTRPPSRRSWRWSPRMRGWSCAASSTPRRPPWSPRMRGWSQGRPRFRHVTNRGPRACGGGPRSYPKCSWATGWSPRMRGWSRARRRAAGSAHVVPAHAGVVPAGRRSGPERGSGPRACGGGPWRCGPVDSGMRGWPLDQDQLADLDRATPACAGMVPNASGGSQARTSRCCTSLRTAATVAKSLSTWSTV